MRQVVIALLGLVSVFAGTCFGDPPKAPAVSNMPLALGPAVQAALDHAGANKEEILKALRQTPASQREAVEFLVANMPGPDLEALKADFLLENTALACQVMGQVPWGGKIPKEIFLNGILPYASINERRDNWRKDFLTRFLPLVKDCKTPGEAGVKLNGKIFGELKVHFSRDRKKADQSPYETIESGKASCTGLSILLVDACRAVGVPARFVGIPLWPDGSGNHSWVEIWNEGWHFTGAAEPTNLDQGWFVGSAAGAQRDNPLHAIYAVSYRRTPLAFPMLWDPAADYVSAVNVTDRYAAPAKARQPGKAVRPAWQTLTSPEQAFADSERGKRLSRLLAAYFQAEPIARAKIVFDPTLDDCLLEHSRAVRKLAWRAYCGGLTAKGLEAEVREHRVTWEKYVSPYVLRAVGSMPRDGWPLFIAMHGGGGAPQEVNDQQWQVMQIYYRDQPSVEGYLYLAPRAPTNDWNGFYAGYNVYLTQKLIRELLVHAEVDPNKVFLMGYSHGGYGAFMQGTEMPDLFAAIHASAAAPMDYDAKPRNLRNTVFTFMIGTQDNAYGRLDKCKWLDGCLKKLRGGRTDIYPGGMELKESGHTGLPDRDKIREMYSAVRNPVPRHLAWTPGGIRDYFNWLHLPGGTGGEIEAACENNQITVTYSKIKTLDLLLDERLIDYGRPVLITANGKKLDKRLSPSLKTLCELLEARGDPEFMFATRVAL